MKELTPTDLQSIALDHSATLLAFFVATHWKQPDLNRYNILARHVFYQLNYVP